MGLDLLRAPRFLAFLGALVIGVPLACAETQDLEQRTALSGRLHCSLDLEPTGPFDCDQDPHAQRTFFVPALPNAKGASFRLVWNATSATDRATRLGVTVRLNGTVPTARDGSSPLEFPLNVSRPAPGAWTIQVRRANDAIDANIPINQTFSFTFLQSAPMAPDLDSGFVQSPPPAGTTTPQGPARSDVTVRFAAPIDAGLPGRAGWASATVAAGATVAILGPIVYWRLWVAGGLFSRLSRHELENHPRRRDLLEAIRAEPGIHGEALRLRLGLGNGTFGHHLRLLARAGLVRTRGDGYRVRLYRADAGPVEPVPSARERLASAVRDRPGQRLVDLARHVSLPESNVRYHVRRLVQQRRVRLTNDGRSVRCYPLPDSPRTIPS